MSMGPVGPRDGIYSFLTCVPSIYPKTDFEAKQLWWYIQFQTCLLAKYISKNWFGGQTIVVICISFYNWHGIAWYCITLHDIAWYCTVLHGIAWQYMVLQRFYLFWLGQKYEKLEVGKARSKKLDVGQLEVGRLEVGKARSRRYWK